ncbi:esterase [Nakamurella antarctica]|uniref:Esterase n=1 Tax=Nakamurella antarctica TaxID=1902245 RepID=A0A3G8ZQ24_9ACTN|nr:alpha/beta hydrolase-fold protein [Nakamurella antarctica]AZI58905.1 esterase [Nakamurella antarctica]
MNIALLSTTFRVVSFVIAIIAIAALLASREEKWWSRRVPLAFGITAAVIGMLLLIVEVWWQPFQDPVPIGVTAWVAAGCLAITVATLRLRGKNLRARAPKDSASRVWPHTIATTLTAVIVVICAAAQVNQTFGAYPTLQALFGGPMKSQVAFNTVSGHAQQTQSAPDSGSFVDAWAPPRNQPKAGVVTTTNIPGTVSGFATRNAWIYLPPAYLATPRALLPVLILLNGNPGEPRQWLDGGNAANTMNAYAAEHGGLAPVVVIPDRLGSALANPMCVDSESRGKNFTYLTVDVVQWIKTNLQVNEDPKQWAVGGLSSGGTCAAQLALNAPDLFPTFLDLSGQDTPTIGSHSQTVRELFGGSEAAFTAADPLSILASRKFPQSAGFFAAGSADSVYGPQTHAVYIAAKAAGMDATYAEVPGGHDFFVWTEALQVAMPWLGPRFGLTA